MHDQGLAYFRYSSGKAGAQGNTTDVKALLDQDILTISPLIYEDFLPVSAAGIFQSNLGDEARDNTQTASNQSEFEAALGAPVLDEFKLYEDVQTQSLNACLRQQTTRDRVA